MENVTKASLTLPENPERNVLLADLQTIHNKIDTDIEEALLAVLRSGRYVLGPEVEKFESWMARYCGVKHAVGCASGTDALLLALMACGVGPGDEVVTTPFTFFSTASVIARLGARPVFCDIGAGTFHLCPAQLRETLNHHPSVKAVIAVGLFGACPDIDSLRAAVAPEVKLIEDAAQTLGATYKGRPSGSLGDVSCVSFFPTKNLGACGDAGMVLTDSRKTADLIRSLRVHGSSEQYIHTHIGINSRLDAIQAAILSVKARFLDGWNEARRCNAQMYTRITTM